MRLSARPLLAVLALAVQGCINSSLVLHVHADGSGQAVVTSRVSATGVQALDSLFSSEPPKALPTVQELLPAPLPGTIDRGFGTTVRLVSSTVDPSPDGGTRQTVVEFDDVRKLRLVFPFDFSMPGNTFSAMRGIDSGGVIARRSPPN
jgi:hypothetical protein